jgi:hypothetical protein
MDHGVIEVETKFFVLAFLLLFFKPKISIDGYEPQERPWGLAGFTVPPGRHRVTVFVPYLFFPRMGESSIDVDVARGHAVRVRWNAPWLVFMAGRIVVLGAGPAPAGAFAGQQGYAGAPAAAVAPPQSAQAAAPPPAWYADPTGTHEMRYFDGTRWSEHVSDGGVVSTDAR